MNKIDDYSKILSRAQAISLLINAALIVSIPLTYGIDHRLPFLLGTVAYGCLLLAGLRMHEVREKPIHRERRRIQVKSILNGHILAFGILFGVISALFIAPADTFNLALEDFGLRPELLGWIYAAISLTGAVLGLKIYLLKRLPPATYALIDSSLMALPLIAAFTGSVYVVGLALIINFSFWRYRRIIYQDHLLRLYPTKYKATLISATNNAEHINLLWSPIAVTLVVNKFGYSQGL